MLIINLNLFKICANLQIKYNSLKPFNYSHLIIKQNNLTTLTNIKIKITNLK